ncbi:MAG: exo-alpha-sialidase [Bacteroidetes bacterium]|nr:exo-alpha-sialidase [Bacteroidota bacterium]
MQRPILLLLLGLLLVACNKPAGPEGTNNPPSATVAMTPLADLPMAGGDVTGISIAPNNTIVAAVNRKLYSMDAAGGSMQLINGDPVHTSIGLAPGGELYTVADRDFRTYDLAAGTYHSAPIDPAGPFATGRTIMESYVTFSPSGEPYIRIINNTPQTYIYHSTDKGVSWQALALPSGFRYGGGLAFAPNGDILMTSAFGFYRSSDHGATWTTSSPAIANYGPDVLAASNGDIYCWVRGGGGLRVSHNGGASFTDLAQFNRAPYFVDVQQGSDGALYALANRNSLGSDLAARPSSLLRSTDGGSTWKNAFYAQGRVFAMRGSMIAIGLAATGPDNRGGGIAISQNNASTWTQGGMGSVAQIMDVGFDRDGNVMILADNGLYRRMPGGWQTFGTQPGLFSRFASGLHGTLLLANTASVFYSGDNGATWSEDTIPNYQSGIDPPAVEVLLGRHAGGFLLDIASYSDTRGYSNGQLYRVGADGRPVKVPTAPTLSSLVEDANGLLYGATQVLDAFTSTFRSTAYYSSDGGATWTEQKNLKAGQAFNSQNKYFSIDGQASYSLNTLDGTKTVLTLGGFTTAGNLVRRVVFGPDDKLYLITYDSGMFISAVPVR